VTALWCGVLAVLLSLAFHASSGWLIDAFTNVDSVRALARDYALWAALTPVAGFAAFILDGVFVGATQARAMRNAMIVSVALYFPLSLLLLWLLGNHGVWLAIHVFLLMRAFTLLRRYPELERQVGEVAT
jgi:MATE family multidrug resistance protein